MYIEFALSYIWAQTRVEWRLLVISEVFYYLGPGSIIWLDRWYHIIVPPTLSPTLTITAKFHDNMTFLTLISQEWNKVETLWKMGMKIMIYAWMQIRQGFWFLKKMKNGWKISVKRKTLEQVNEVVYLGNMFSRDHWYEIDVERRIAAGNMVNGTLTALMRRPNVSTVWPYTMQFWYRRCYTAAKHGYYRRRMNERWIPWRCDLFVGYAESA